MSNTDTKAPPTDEEIRANREARYEWYGFVADDNVEHLAKRIENLLVGRRYTFVHSNADHDWVAPEVRTGQRLTPQDSKSPTGLRLIRFGEDDHRGEARDFCSIIASDTYGVWAMHSHVATEREAHEMARDPEKVKALTHVVIAGGRTPDEVGRSSSITITKYNAVNPRQRIHWVIAVEPKIEEED